MAYILWALLNMALVVLFIVLCYKAVVLIKQRYGTVLAFVFAICLISTCTHSGKIAGNEARASEAKKWESADEKNYPGLSKQVATVKIADNPMFSTLLVIEYMITESGSIIPLTGLTTNPGFHSGIDWKCNYVTMVQQGARLHYKVNGTLTWKLLPIGSYAQEKIYIGTVDMPSAIR